MQFSEWVDDQRKRSVKCIYYCFRFHTGQTIFLEGNIQIPGGIVGDLTNDESGAEHKIAFAAGRKEFFKKWK